MIDWDTIVIGPTVAVFGQPVLYQPMMQAGPYGPLDSRVPAAPAFAITGVFDSEYLSLQPLAVGDLASGGHPSMVAVPSQISGTRPVLGVQLSQFTTAPAQGDLLTIVATGAVYVVQEVRPDGHGAAKLPLNEA